jgi:tRNA-dihydrouridine synthase 3
MVVARRLKQRRRGEFALIRRAPNEPCFAVQLAGNRREELAWAAALVEARGADFIDLNLGCPIDHFTRKGLGAALARQPNRVRARSSRRMRAAVKVPVTVKIRDSAGRREEEFPRSCPRRRSMAARAPSPSTAARARRGIGTRPTGCDFARRARVSVPVVGNGDVLFAHEIQEHLASSGCAAVMTARGALIKPWIFREAASGYWDITAEERLAIYRRYVELASAQLAPAGRRVARRVRTHAPSGIPAVARRLLVPLRASARRWHVANHAAARIGFVPRSPLEALFARTDDVALDYVTDELIAGGDLAHPPDVHTSDEADRSPLDRARRADLVEAG